MFCSYCGTPNDKESRFCKSCGRELSATPSTIEGPTPSNRNSQNIHNSIIRKSIKKDAKEKNKGTLIGGYFLFLVLILAITFIIGFIIAGTNIVSTGSQTTMAIGTTISVLLASIILILLAVVFVLGLSKVSLDILRNQETSVGKILSYPFSKIKVMLKLFVIMFLMGLGLYIVELIPIIGIIVGLVAAIYLMPASAMLQYVAIDNENASIKELVTSSLNLVKGDRIAFYGLVCSFLGWYILSIFTCGILFIWLLPYMMLAIANFYRYLKKEATFETEKKGLGNGAIIGITIGGYLLFIIAIVIMIFINIPNGSFDIFGENRHQNPQNDSSSYYYDDNDENDGTVIEVLGLNLYVPEDYIETSREDYNKVYLEPSGKCLLGIITDDLPNTDSKTYASVYQQYMQQSSYSCSSPVTTPINNNNWEIVDCTGTDANSRSYLNIRNGKLYHIVISYTPSGRYEVDDLYDKLERELSFTNQVA